MSDTVIDNKVVKMEFNNENFERGVGHTLASLQRLSEGLRSINGAKQFQDINAAANGIDLSRIAAGVDALTDKFSVLGVAGMTVVNRLTNGLMDLVHKGLSQAISGGMSRALNLEQASFMLKNTFKDAKDTEAEVEKVMEAVNNSVDKTRFGLDQAAKAAAQLTASGVMVGDGMEEALAGIAGLATIANTDYDSISHIFTAVAGQGKLMTIQMRQLELRGVNVAAEMAKVWPQIHKGAHKTEEEIRDMVSKGKIDFNEFSQAMNLAFGESSKKANETFTGALANMKAAISRIGALFAVPYIENMRKVFVSMIGVFNALKTAMIPVADAFSKIFGSATDKFVKVVDEILEFGTDKTPLSVKVWDYLMKTLFMDGSKNAENLKDTLYGLKSVFTMLKDAISAMKPVLTPLGNIGKNALSLVLSITGAIGRFLVWLNETIYKNQLFELTVSLIVKALESLKRAAASVGDALKKPFENFGYDKDGFLIRGLDLDLKKLTSVKDKIVKILDAIGGAIKKTFGAIAKVFKGGDLKPILQLIEGGMLVTIGLSINRFFTTLTTGATSMNSVFESLKGVANIKDNIVGVLDAVKGRLTAWEDDIDEHSLIKIAGAIAILAASLVVIASIDGEKLAKSLAGVSILMMATMKSIRVLAATFEGQGLTQGANMIAAATAIELLAGGILILATAMRVLAKLNLSQLAKGLGSIYLLLQMFSASSEYLATEGKNMIRNSIGFVIFGAAIRVMAESVKVFGDMDLKSLAKGLVSVIALIGAISLITSKFSPNVGIIDSAGILILAFALQKLTDTVIVFSKMKVKELEKGVGAVAALLVALGGFSYLMGRSRHVLKSAASIYILAESLHPLVSAVAILGHMDLKRLGIGLGALAAGLTLMVASLKILKSGLRAAISLKIVTSALTDFVTSLQRVGAMKSSALERGLEGLALGLLAMVAAMSIAQHAVLGAATIVIMAEALRILAPVILAFGDMSWEQAGKALVTIAGAFLVLAGASVLLLPAVPAMLAFGAAVTVLGVGLLAAGTGILAFTSAIALMAELTGAGIESAKIAIVSLSETFPTIFENVALGIVAMAQTLRDHIPELMELGFELLMSLLTGIRDHIGEITAVVADIVIKFLDALALKIPEIIDALFVSVISVIDGLATAIYTRAGEIAAAVDRLVGAIAYFVLEAIGTIVQHIPVIGDMLAPEIDALQDKIVDEFDLDKMSDAGEDIVNAAAAGSNVALQNAGFDTIGEESGGKYASGVESKHQDAYNAGGYLASETGVGLDSKKDEHYNAGVNAAQGFLNGLNSKIDDIKEKAKEMAEASSNATKKGLKEQSPSRVFIGIGQYVGEGFVIGIESYKDKVAAASSDMAGMSIDTVNSLSKRLAESMSDDTLHPTIRPVLDLSDVEAGEGRIDSMFGGVSLGTSLSFASDASASMRTNQNGSQIAAATADRLIRKMNDLEAKVAASRIDPELMYEAVYAGSSQATPNIRLNNRELNRELRSMGVAYR